jgi:hypothetical protein
MQVFTYNEFLCEDIIGSVLQQLLAAHRFLGQHFRAKTSITVNR